MMDTPADSGHDLRQLAEEKVRQEEIAGRDQISPEAALKLLHELRVHQVELEMQNEELRRTQQQLDASRARYFDLYNLAPIGYLTISDQGIIEEVNLTCADLLGVVRGDLVKRPLSQFIFSEDQDIYYLHRKQLVETGEAQVCDLRMVRGDGSLFWANLQTVLAPDGDGGAGWRMVMSDCTSHKLAEIEVRNAYDQWEKTFDAIEDVVTIHDHDMRIIRANKAAGILFQVAPEELIGKRCYEVFRGADTPCPGCPEIFARTTQMCQQANIYHKNLGKTFAAASCPLVDSRGLNGFVHIAKDITDYLKMEERLRQSQKMEAIGTLAGGIAHDFNNILVPILGYAELAATRVTANNPLSSDLQQIIRAALRAKDMISQILSFSRQIPQEKHPFRPHLVVQEALRLLQSTLPATIEIETEIATDCGMILADPTQLHQIVVNLCTNAYHSMRENGGVLRVSLEKVRIGKEDSRIVGLGVPFGDYIVLGVSDTGCGMECKTLERIFEPYFTTKGKDKGSGLGLSVVHGIVKNCRGQITVSSEPGKGTCFQVYLPLVVEEEVVEDEADLSFSRASNNERVLVVDDDNIITSMLQTILTGLGYRVIVFNNSQEALTFIAQEPTTFDLLITDMTMPLLTGLGLSQKALAIRPDLPIILCTGYSEMINKEQALKVGVKEYLMKPFTVHELTWALDKVLEKKEKIS